MEVVRKALIIGIDGYTSSPLEGCVKDAKRMKSILSSRDKNGAWFECTPFYSDTKEITRNLMLDQIEHLFKEEAYMSLLYFSGHGSLNHSGGFLISQDCDQHYDKGVSMNWMLQMANQSPVKEIVILLDCCHSGAFGNVPANGKSQALIREGVTILAASRPHQYAVTTRDGSIFTKLIANALEGAAKDLLGYVTASSIYAYVDQLLDASAQRPIFKSHVSSMTLLRTYDAKIERSILQQITKYFMNRNHTIKLNQRYLKESKQAQLSYVKAFEHLQLYNQHGLIEHRDAPDLYTAAQQKKTCRLTEIGQFYWELVKKNRI